MPLVHTYDGVVKTVGGVVLAGCCCGPVIPSVPDCDSYPLNWEATISGMLTNPNAAQQSALIGVADPNGRVFCVIATQRFSRWDFTPADGTHIVPYVSTTGGTREWKLTGVLEFREYKNVSGSIDDIGLIDDTLFTIQVDGCTEGPGDVTISASYSTTLPTGVTSVFGWNKTITLSAGQKLKDLASISLDPIVGTYVSGAGYSGATYYLDVMFGCSILTGAAMLDYPGPLVLVPAP